MDNGENSENNEPGTSGMRHSTRNVSRLAIQDQHSSDSDDMDQTYEPPQDEILESGSELFSSPAEPQRMSERESRLRKRLKVRASQDAVYALTRSQLIDDRNRLTSFSDEYNDNIPLYMLKAAHRVSTPNHRSKYKKIHPFKPSIIWKHVYTHPLDSSITCCNHYDKIWNNLRGSASNALVHLRKKHMDVLTAVQKAKMSKDGETSGSAAVVLNPKERWYKEIV